MTRIINCRLINDDLVSIEIKNNQIFRIVSQSDGLLSAPENSASMVTAASKGRSLVSDETIDARGELILPAAIDAHIHARSPGLEQKEDWHTVGACAAKGGVAAVVDMPNTIPPTLFREQVIQKAELAAKSGIDFRILVGVSTKNIASLKTLLEETALPTCGVKVFYGPSTGDLVFSDLKQLSGAIPKRGRRLLVFHSEDQCGIDCNREHMQEEYQKACATTDPNAYSIHSRMRDSNTAWTSTAEILKWAETYDGPVHIAHVSTPREVDMILAAKSRGAQITCEVAPHHILLSTEDYGRLGGYLKVNPPVRSLAEVMDLRQHLACGHIDIIATDHAPHLREEKLRPYDQCPSGMPSLDFFYPLAFAMAEACGMQKQQVLPLVSEVPAKIFGFSSLKGLQEGAEASFVWYKELPLKVTAKEVVSKCGWSPYDGMVLPGRVAASWRQGRCIYAEKESQSS